MSYRTFFNKLKKIEQASIKEESITKYTFNIFSILRKYDEEVGLHSRFLAEMLNPKGSHSMSIFQQLFIEQVINPAIEAQEWQRELLDSTVKYNCKTEEYYQGLGRVDIVLKSDENVIVIENKIHAADQKNQLQRYFEACEKLGYCTQNIYILYLNKTGVKVTNHGQGKLQDDQFGQISYKEDISSWLDLCVNQVKSYPHIEQTLLQYKRLIASLIGDNRSVKMKNSHVELLYQDDNFKLAYELSQSLDDLQIDLQKKVWQALLIAFESKGYNFKFCDKDLQSCDENKKIKNYYKTKSKKNRFYGVQCEIGSLDKYTVHCFIQLNHNIYYGLTVSDNKKRIKYPNNFKELADKILSIKKIVESNDKVRESSNNWFLGVHILPNEPINFKNVRSIYHLVEQSSRSQWVEQTVDEIVKFIKDMKTIAFIEP